MRKCVILLHTLNLKHTHAECSCFKRVNKSLKEESITNSEDEDKEKRKQIQKMRTRRKEKKVIVKKESGKNGGRNQ